MLDKIKHGDIHTNSHFSFARLFIYFSSFSCIKDDSRIIELELPPIQTHTHAIQSMKIMSNAYVMIPFMLLYGCWTSVLDHSRMAVHTETEQPTVRRKLSFLFCCVCLFFPRYKDPNSLECQVKIWFQFSLFVCFSPSTTHIHSPAQHLPRWLHAAMMENL